MEARDVLENASRLVVKVGSAILCDEIGIVKRAWLEAMAADIVALQKAGKEVIIVSSGAVALGSKRLGLKRGLRLEEKQAASAAGQAALTEAWRSAFAGHSIEVAQVLITLGDTEDRRRYLNMRATIRTLSDLGAIPVVNENDTVATAEIRYGDNDRLAAHVAQVTEADLLLILSDIDGLYTTDPSSDPGAEHIPFIDALTPAVEEMAGGPNARTGLGSGGMASKLAAAKIAGRAGCVTVIAPGVEAHPVSHLLSGGRSTVISSTTTKRNARRQWIAGRLQCAGAIIVDTGAINAILRGASLLPAGIIRVEGDFLRGDQIEITDDEGRRIAYGLASYEAKEVQKVIGQQSDAVHAVLGYRRRPAVVERNDMVVIIEERAGE